LAPRQEEGDAVRIVKVVAALCFATAFAFVGCAAQQSARSPQSGATTTTGGGPSAAQSTSAQHKFGEAQFWEKGLSITVSTPRSLTPSDNAFPQSPRAVVFEVTIDNRTTDIYKPALLVVKATANGQSAAEIVDPAQGLNGIVSGAQDVPPGKTLKLTVAFAVPAASAKMELTVQPDGGIRYSTHRYEGEG
jgi:hypothetical protein